VSGLQSSLIELIENELRAARSASCHDSVVARNLARRWAASIEAVALEQHAQTSVLRCFEGSTLETILAISKPRVQAEALAAARRVP
jgi:hypothetical protein